MKKIIILSIICLSFIASFAQLKVANLEVTTYPEPYSTPFTLVQDEGKNINFYLANYSELAIIRATKMFMTSDLDTSVIWESVIYLEPWEYTYIEISGCGENSVSSSPGNYSISLHADNTYELDAINLGSPLVECCPTCDECLAEQEINILSPDSFDAGCNENNYYIHFIQPNENSILRRNEVFSILWDDNLDDDVEIKVYRNNGTQYEGTIAPVIASNGSFDWFIDETFPCDNDYQILIQNEGNNETQAWSELFEITDDSAPHPNNYPCSAKAINVLNEISYSLATNLGSSDSGIDEPTCGNYNTENDDVGDIWFWFVAPESGRAYINFDTVGLDLNHSDFAVAAYRGNCGDLSIIDCDSDNGPLTMPYLELNDLIPSEIIFLRVWYERFDYVEMFEYCVTDPAYNFEIDFKSSWVSPNEFQKGEIVSIGSFFQNIGPEYCVATFYLNVYDEQMNFMTHLDSETGFGMYDYIQLEINNSLDLDPGNYFLVVEYYDYTRDANIVLDQKEFTVQGLEINGEEPINVNKSLVDYFFESEVISQSTESVDILGFVVLTNIDNGDLIILQMDEIDTKSDFTQFNLDFIFAEVGEYEAQYVAFYDWDEDQGGDTIPWFTFLGPSYYLEIYYEELEIVDITQYEESTIQNYSLVPFEAQINNGSGQDIDVQIRFFSPNQELVYENMTMDDISQHWLLEKSFQEIGLYQYRFLAIQNGDTTFYPSLDNNALNIEILPALVGNEAYWDMTDEIIVNNSFVNFFCEVNINEDEIDEIKIKFDAPDGHTYWHYAEHLDGIVYFYSNSLSQAGYYSYSYVLTLDNGQSFETQSWTLFVGFDNNCNSICQPAMINRSLWCPRCQSDNPNNGAPTHIIIHHSVTPNGDNSYDRVRNIRNTHLSIGDPDIAYHYLIGSDGTIFEGLQGGPEKKGAHFSCMNGRTIAICLLGNFHENVPGMPAGEPSDEAMRSLDLLLTWLCYEYNIEATGTLDHVFWDYGNNEWLINSDMPQIAPHNISSNYPENACSFTSCPGQLFPDIATFVAPNILTCQNNQGQQMVELDSDILLNIDENAKSNHTLISVQTSVVSLFYPLELDFRALIIGYDSLLIDDIVSKTLLVNQSTNLFFEDEFVLDTGNYFIAVQYRTPGDTTWYNLNSELYANMEEITLEVPLNLSTNTDNLISILIYPNPAKSEISIQCFGFEENELIQYEIYNILAIKITEGEFRKRNIIDVSFLSPGIYVINIKSKNKNLQEKLIIEQ